MATIYIARHGETTWNVTGRYQGHRESSLSPLGQAQARALAAALRTAGLERIVSSPLQRCLQTAQPVAEATGAPVATDARLLEIAHGTWEGRYRDEIAANDPDRYHQWRNLPALVQFEGGESVADVLERWRSFVAGFDASQTTLIVTHDVVVRLAILERTGRGASDLWRPRVVNGAYAQFTVENDRWQLVRECADAHLAGVAADIGKQAL